MTYLSMFLALAAVTMTVAAIVFGRDADRLADYCADLQTVDLCRKAQIADMIEYSRELTAASVASSARINELLDLVRAQSECISAQEQEIAQRGADVRWLALGDLVKWN